MYFTKFPSILQNLYPRYLWREKPKSKKVYLTFDDGPTPGVSEWVLEQLARYQALATFFVLGKQVVENPSLTHQVIDAGHSLGNHGFTHLNGWRVSLHQYLRDFLKAQQAIMEYSGYKTELFRPPYGRIGPRQAKRIMRSHQIVMMDVMAGDFDPKLSPEAVVRNVTEQVVPGSIVCLHDSEKAWPRLRFALPEILDSLQAQGYAFAALNPTPLKSRATR